MIRYTCRDISTFALSAGFTRAVKSAARVPSQTARARRAVETSGYMSRPVTIVWFFSRLVIRSGTKWYKIGTESSTNSTLTPLFQEHIQLPFKMISGWRIFLFI